MLIVFDLDDTLIDTQNCLTKFKLETALQMVVDQGFRLKKKFNKSVKELIRLNQNSKSAKEALRIFFKDEVHFFELAQDHVYNSSIDSYEICANPSVLIVLEELSRNHTLALVTMGDKHRQLVKLKKAGINIDLFSKIVVTNETKLNAYIELVQEFKMDKENTLVCGDKFSIDLLPAIELGLITVQVSWGRKEENNAQADYLINHFEKLKDIVNIYENKR